MKSVCVSLLAGLYLVLPGCMTSDPAPVRHKPRPASQQADGKGPVQQLYLLASPYAVNLGHSVEADGFVVKVYASNFTGPKPVPILSGTLEVLMMDGVLTNPKAEELIPLQAWSFDGRKLKSVEARNAIGLCYQLALAWGDKRPTKDRATLVARYQAGASATNFIYSAPSVVSVRSK